MHVNSKYVEAVLCKHKQVHKQIQVLERLHICNYVYLCVNVCFAENTCRYWRRQREGSVIWQVQRTSSWWPSTLDRWSQPIPARGAQTSTHRFPTHTNSRHSRTANFHSGGRITRIAMGCSCQHLHLTFIWLKRKNSTCTLAPRKYLRYRGVHLFSELKVVI